MGGCSVGGCEGHHVARGFCHRHYRQFLREGGERKVHLVRHYGHTTEQRFWLYTKRQKGCWEWTGYRNEKGYGVLNLQGKRVLAPRLAFQLYRGEIPKARFVLHTCDNPGCVNPAHLWIGTLRANNNDMNLKGRQHTKPMLGISNHQARLTEDQVRAIRASDESGPVLSERYGVTRTTICSIRKRRLWAHIE